MTELTRHNRTNAFRAACRRYDKRYPARFVIEAAARKQFDTACDSVEGEGKLSNFSAFSVFMQTARYAYRCLIQEAYATGQAVI